MKLRQANIKEYLAIIAEHLEKAYAPYSHFPVAALLLVKDGKYYTGINIENVSFGATNCAERTAIFSAVNDGYRKQDFQALFVIAKTEKPIAPCSICRQVFVEFFDEQMPIYLANVYQEFVTYTVADLVPYAFDSL